ncbi:RagB/SusD family nutrient uptake outer membrane protein [Flavobacterium muglaense]|uniref:RagB/SusD family nutrient uptake outer membrane protein n=1 Tax=Flavobacterium muglaense TaxID=2764716 RepID=A0A923SER3_9FLAO|nr:RagB/SusD family nutrient uptake outer membrane protein [Flavobacterium muglaense]MBC5836439.1 RagB/SusD family nutrient uptake outer membrane protein [Flavobacterium muglaense]MBC5842969.1 RagB/SusD family nutrient uptake outer membrane protein [Flavobacterium muglaense]
MKKYKYIFLLIGLSIVGCSDLEEEPIGLLAPEGFFQSTGDIQTAVNGAYGHMLHRNFMSREMSMSLMLRSDMVNLNKNVTNAERVQFNDIKLLADNANIAVYCPKCYQIIGAANQAIAGSELVSADVAVKNKIIAQAYFARAFVYYHLVRQFGDIPYLDKPVTDIQAASTMSKTPAAQVYLNIIEDLKFAKEWLPNTQTTRAIPAKSAASGYLAEVYLTIGEFQKSYDEAKDIISKESTYNLGLEADFQNLFDATKSAASKEPLFLLDFNGQSDGDQARNYQAAFTGIRNDAQYGYGGGWSVEVPALAVYTTWDSRDYRKAFSLDATAVFKGVTVDYTQFTNTSIGGYAAGDNSPHIAKFTRKAGPAAEGNGRTTKSDYIMMRYAEVLLIAAEALNEITPGTTEADGYINRVRARARNTAGVATTFPANVTTGLSKDAFRTLVLEERRLELAFEFKRWYDIARRKLGTTVFSASGLEGAKANFDPARDYLFPLPSNELVRNPNLLPQNPGY